MEISADAISGDSGSKPSPSSTTSEKTKEDWDLLLDGVGIGSRNWPECASLEPGDIKREGVPDGWSTSDLSGVAMCGWGSLEATGVSGRDRSSSLACMFCGREVIVDGIMECIQYDS